MNLDDKIEKLNNKCNEYEGRVGLAPILTSEDENGACAYLKYDRQQFEAMTPEDCAIAQAEIAQFGFHLRRSLNRLSSLIRWLEDEQNITLGDFMEYEYSHIYGAENKKITAIAANEYTRTISRKLQDYCAAKERFEGLDYKLGLLADAIKSLSMSKMSRMKHDNITHY